VKRTTTHKKKKILEQNTIQDTWKDENIFSLDPHLIVLLGLCLMNVVLLPPDGEALV
jgi:hypothetical protein